MFFVYILSAIFSSLLFLCRFPQLLFFILFCLFIYYMYGLPVLYFQHFSNASFFLANLSSFEQSLTSHKRSMSTAHNVTCCDPVFVSIYDNRSGHNILPMMILHGREAVASSFVGIIRSRQGHLTLDASGSQLCSHAVVIVNPFPKIKECRSVKLMVIFLINRCV
jgi:hypothetical protein